MTPLRPDRNYLRVRGEYNFGFAAKVFDEELPPRARRIHAVATKPPTAEGTTSACAENTPSKPPSGPPRRNYLRVRGEYTRIMLRASISMELPPRARRIHVDNQTVKKWHRTTSACAENTNFIKPAWDALGNYLRVRGEYLITLSHTHLIPELPPRARRILNGHSQSLYPRGTTSACAENTSDGKTFPMIFWNYLRVRGEYVPLGHMEVTHMELPPRARRIHGECGVVTNFAGTTSACAENTLNELGLL